MSRLARIRSARIFGQRLAAGVEDEGRVVGRHKMAGSVGVHRSAEGADALGAPEEEPGGEVPQGDHDRRVDEGDLFLQVRSAGLDLAGEPGPGSGADDTSPRWRYSSGRGSARAPRRSSGPRAAPSGRRTARRPVLLATGTLADEQEAAAGDPARRTPRGCALGQRARGAVAKRGGGAQTTQNVAPQHRIDPGQPRRDADAPGTRPGGSRHDREWLPRPIPHSTS